MIRMRPVVQVTAAFLLAATVGIVVGACGSARHKAVQSHAAATAAVFSLDDAEYTACQQKQLTEAQCAKLDPLIVTALRNVRAVTAALQTAPNTVPTTLPALISDLETIRTAVGEFPDSALVRKLNAWLTVAIDGLRAFQGGK